MAKKSQTIFIVLVVLAIIAVGALQIKNLPSGELTALLNLASSGTFWINFAIIGILSYLFANFIPPLNKNKETKTQVIVGIIVVGFSLFMAYYLGKAEPSTLVYNSKHVKWILFDAAGKFTYKPIANIIFFWGLFTIVGPFFFDKLKQLKSESNGTANLVFIILMIGAAIGMASNIAPNAFWEEPTFVEAEHYLLGARQSGAFLGHSGTYADEGETKFGILYPKKIKISEPGLFGSTETTTRPITTFFLGIVSFGIILMFLSAKFNLGNMGGFQKFIITIVAAEYANTGSSFGLLFWLVWLGIALSVGLAIHKSVNIKLIATWVGLMVADLAFELIPFDLGLGWLPPIFPENIMAKALVSFVVALILTIGMDTIKYGYKSIAKIRICKKCGQKVDNRKVNGKYVCSKCSFECETCGNAGTLQSVNVRVCENGSCSLAGRVVTAAVCPTCSVPTVAQTRNRIWCTPCNKEIRNDIETVEVEGLEVLGASWGAKLGPGLAQGVTSGARRAGGLLGRGAIGLWGKLRAGASRATSALGSMRGGARP
jgi:hypothetical protein